MCRNPSLLNWTSQSCNAHASGVGTWPHPHAPWMLRKLPSRERLFVHVRGLPCPRLSRHFPDERVCWKHPHDELRHDASGSDSFAFGYASEKSWIASCWNERVECSTGAPFELRRFRWRSTFASLLAWTIACSWQRWISPTPSCRQVPDQSCWQSQSRLPRTKFLFDLCEGGKCCRLGQPVGGALFGETTTRAKFSMSTTVTKQSRVLRALSSTYQQRWSSHCCL